MSADQLRYGEPHSGRGKHTIHVSLVQHQVTSHSNGISSACSASVPNRAFHPRRSGFEPTPPSLGLLGPPHPATHLPSPFLNTSSTHNVYGFRIGADPEPHFIKKDPPMFSCGDSPYSDEEPQEPQEEEEPQVKDANENPFVTLDTFGSRKTTTRSTTRS